MKTALIALLITVSTYVSADDRVFISKVENQVVALKAAKTAFIKKRWNIIAEDSNSIQGELNHRDIEAKVRIIYKDNALYYSCECFKVYTDSYYEDDDDVTRKAYVPEKWINNLRIHAELFLVESFRYEPTTTNTNKSSTETPKQRLKTLKSLLDDGLISHEEYDQKRKAIIDGI